MTTELMGLMKKRRALVGELSALDRVIEREVYEESRWRRSLTPNPKQTEVLFLRGVGMTLEEIGKQMGVTRERVRQIEAGALEKKRMTETLSL
jgi:hypothetical protein